MRNFIGNCPDPVYERYREKNSRDLTKSLLDYLGSEDYKKEKDLPQACVISQEELEKELDLIKDISNPDLKKETQKIYSKIKENIKDKKRLTLIWKERGYENQKPEILLHEFVHELLESNGIVFSSWKWNEGLVTYINYREIDKLGRVYRENLNKRYSEMWKTYSDYTKKWIQILDKENNPMKRKKLILNKLESLEQ